MDDERINPFIRVDINSEPKNMDENGSTGCVSNNQQVQKQDQQSYPSQTMTVGYVHPQPMALYPLAPEVKTHQRTESDISGKESSVFIDYKEKKIFFIKQHTRTDNNYVQTNYCEYFTGSKSTKKRSIIQIADGVFSILRISSDEMNNKTISIKVNDIDEELVITLSDVVTCSNTVLRKFGEKGLLIKPKYKTPICEYIFNVAKNLEVNEKHMGFYYDRNGTLAHDDELIIYRLACEQIEALRFFDIDKGIHNDTQKYNMLMFCLLGISSMLTCLNRSKVSGLPLIVFWADNIIDAYKELTDLFANGIYRRESETIKTEKEISALYEQVDCFIPIIVDKAVSPRNFSANKQANCLIIANNARQDTIATSLPVIITSDPSLFKNMSAMVFRYNSIIIKHSNAVYNCFRQYVLKNNSSSMIPLETQKDISIEKRFFSEKYGSSKATLYMLLKYVFLWFVIQDVTANNSFKYIVYLNNLFWSDNNSGTNAERFCKNLVSCKELTRVDRITATEYSDMCMYLDRNGISMSLDTFKFLAKKSLCDADMLKEELKNKGLLVIDTGTYQKNISICGKVRNVYCISQSALYGKYNVVMCSNEFIDKAPDYKLRLGVNNDTEIYYTFDSVAKADNQHCFVFGNSGCGKTTLLKSMICEAARNNFECLVIDAKLDYSSFSGEHFNHIRFGDKSGYTLCSTINAESIIRLMQCIGMHLTSSIERKIKLKCDPIARKTNYAVLKEYLDDCYLMLSDDPKTEELAEMIFELGEHPICRGKLLDWQSILQKGKAVIFDLPYDQIVTDDEALSNIADTVLQSFFMYKRTKNPPLEERIPCMVFIDEVKNYKIGTKSAISNILSQGRSSNIAAVLATQYLSADNGTKVSAVIGQCNTVVSFGTAESSYAVKVLECSSEEKKEMADALRELSVGEAIVYSKEKTVSTDTSYVHNYLKVRFNDFCSGEYPELFVSSRR